MGLGLITKLAWWDGDEMKHTFTGIQDPKMTKMTWPESESVTHFPSLSDLIDHKYKNKS